MSFISICIPTRNRAGYLDFLLSEIAKFKRLDYEVVISDNASDDDTATVVMRWRSELKRLYYLRQNTAISGPENACAVCNSARGDYIFRISDDDLVVEDGLLAAQAILDTAPNSTAVYPRWHICDSTLENIQTIVYYGADEALNRNKTDCLDASPHAPIRITRTQSLEMYERFWTVEMPVFRRDIFQRHTGIISNQMPLNFYAAALFLKHGDIHFIWDLCAKIRHHPEQDLKSLHSPRVLEAYASDYEEFLSCIPGLDPIEAMKAFYGKMVRQYLLSSQFAIMAGDHLRAIEIIRKSLAFKVPGVAEFASEFEKTHSTAIIVAYISKMLKVTSNVHRLLIEDCSESRELVPLIHQRIATIPIALLSADELISMPAAKGDFILAHSKETYEAKLASPGINPARLRLLPDIQQACRFE